jgi:hypothetical protein
MNRQIIELGDVVKDSITGLEGVAVAITTWLNGCVRVVIQPKEIKDGKPVDTSCFDVEQLELVKSAKTELAATGGDHPSPARQPDPRR